MQITNNTHWDTRSLRRVFAVVLRRWNKLEKPRRRVPSKRLRITIVHSRYRGPSGCAYLNSGTMRLRLPKDDLDVRKVAFLFEHELAHCAGYTHDVMPDLKWSAAATERFTLVDGMTIERKAARVAKPKPDVQRVRYERAVANLRAWEAKKKRAETAIRKYKQQVRYYERALAAKA